MKRAARAFASVRPYARMRLVRSALVLCVIVGASVALAAGLSAAADIAGDAEGPTASVLNDPEIQAAAQRSLEEQRRRDAARDTLAERSDRAESRDMYRDLSASEALEADRGQLPEVVRDPAFTPFEPSGGAHVERYRDEDTSAVIETVGGDHVIAESNLPLRGTNAAGERAPVDLTLEVRGDRFAATSAPVRASLPARLGSGAALPYEGGTILVRAPGASVPSTRADDDKLLYANAQADSDVLAATLPTGVEFSNIVRSPDAPESFAYELGGLPPGAELRLAANGHAAVVVNGEQLLAVVDPPTAMAADGEPLPVALSVDGNRVELTVRHRERDVAYPLVLDPKIETFTWHEGTTTDFNGWAYSFVQGLGSPSHASGLTQAYSSVFGTGLFVKTNGGYLYNQDDGINRFSAPGDAYVYRADFNLANWNYTTTGGLMCTNAGIYAPSRGAWDSSAYVNCNNFTNFSWGVCVSGTYPNCDTNAGTARNAAETDFWAWGNGQRPALTVSGWTGTGAFSYTGDATVYVNDRFAPTVGWQGAAPPTGWTKSSASYTLNATDGGLGLKTFAISSSLAGWGGASLATGCTGTRFDRATAPPKCDNTAHPLTFNLGALAEGAQSLRAAATDALDQAATPLDYPVKIDRTDPVVDTSGELDIAEDDRLSTDSPTLDVLVTDDDGASSSSGVKSIEVKFDGVDSTPATNLYQRQGPCDGCELQHTFTLNTSSLAAGVHTVDVIATDFADNTDDQTWEFTIDRTSLQPSCASPDSDPGVCRADPPPGSSPSCTTAPPVPQSAGGSFVTADQAVQTTRDRLPTALAASDSATLEHLNVAPVVAPTAGASGYPASAALAPASLGTNAATYTVGSGASALCVSPATTTSNAPAPRIVDGQALEYADTAASTDTILRPMPLGVTNLTQIRDASAPDTFSYQVGLQGSQYLKQLDSGAIAVIDPSLPPISTSLPDVDLGNDAAGGSTEAADATAEPSDDPTDPSLLPDSAFADRPPADGNLPPNATENNYENENGWINYANQDADGQEVGIITPPDATDKNGVGVSADLALTGPTTLTVTISHHASTYQYPIMAKSKGLAPWPPRARQGLPDKYMIDAEGPADLKARTNYQSPQTGSVEGAFRVRHHLGIHRARHIMIAGVCDDWAGTETKDNQGNVTITPGDATTVRETDYAMGTDKRKKAHQCKRAVDFINAANDIGIRDGNDILITISPRTDQAGGLPFKPPDPKAWATSIRRLWITRPFDIVKNWGPTNEPDDSHAAATTGDATIAARMWRRVKELGRKRPKPGMPQRCPHCRYPAGDFSQDEHRSDGTPNYAQRFINYLANDHNGQFAKPFYWAIHAHGDLYYVPTGKCYNRDTPGCDKRQFGTVLNFVDDVRKKLGNRRKIWVDEAGMVLSVSPNKPSTKLTGCIDCQRRAAREFLRLPGLRPMITLAGYYRFFGHSSPRFDSALVKPPQDPVLNPDGSVPPLDSSTKFRPAYCVLIGKPNSDLCTGTGGT